MSKDETVKKNWFLRHKVLTVIGAIVVIAIISSAANSGKSSNSQSVPAASTGAQPATATPASDASKMTISNSSYSSSNGMQQVVGEVKNNDSSKHSATLKATFYAADGSIKGTAEGAVNDVAAGETKTFTLMTSDDVAGYASMKVQVDTLL